MRLKISLWPSTKMHLILAVIMAIMMNADQILLNAIRVLFSLPIIVGKAKIGNNDF